VLGLLVSCFVFSVFPLCYCFVVSTSAVDCLKTLVSEVTYYVLSGTLNPTHSLTLFFHSMLKIYLSNKFLDCLHLTNRTEFMDCRLFLNFLCSLLFSFSLWLMHFFWCRAADQAGHLSGFERTLTLSSSIPLRLYTLDILV